MSNSLTRVIHGVTSKVSKPIRYHQEHVMFYRRCVPSHDEETHLINLDGQRSQ